MKYEVFLVPSAKADIFEVRAWLIERDPELAERWLWECSEAVTSLREFPKRCKVSDESVAFPGIEVRELLFGPKRHGYRVLFAIEEERVNVLRVRSTRQRPLSEQPDD